METPTANLTQGVRQLARRFELPALWRWWTGELGRALPASSLAAVQRRRARPILAFGADAVVLWVPRVTAGKLELHPAARIPRDGDPAAVAQAGRDAIENLARKAYGGAVAATRLRVALPPTQVLRKTLVLPAAVEENLRQAIGWDLDRHTPFPPEQVHFDAVVVDRDLQKKTIRVDWAAALKTHVDAAVRQAQSWGATVVAVTPEMPAGNDPAPLPATRLNLLPDEARPDAATWRRRQLWLPLCAVLVAVAAAVAVPIWQKRERVIAMLRETAEARAQAAVADGLRAEFERMTGDYNFVLGRKFGFPPAVQLIEDVTRLLPDDTWLLQFELKTPSRGKEPVREVVLRGESGSASRLVALLEESKLFEQASPRSPMTKIQPGPGEIFDLGAQLKPLPPPAMIELVAPAAKDDAAPASGPAAAPAAGAPAPAAAAATPAATPPDATRSATPAKAPEAAPAPSAAPSAAPTAAPAQPAAPASGSAPPGVPPQGATPSGAPLAGASQTPPEFTPVAPGTLPAGGPDPLPPAASPPAAAAEPAPAPAAAAGQQPRWRSASPPRRPTGERPQPQGGGS